MARNRWHIDIDGDRLTLSRAGRDRFDFVVETSLPNTSRHRVAHQIRQDMWRALQSLRGFSPLIEVTRTEVGLSVKAGGQVNGNFPRELAIEIVENLVSNSKNRARWERYAALKRIAA